MTWEADQLVHKFGESGDAGPLSFWKSAGIAGLLSLWERVRAVLIWRFGDLEIWRFRTLNPER
jgi:hypothetical protein